MPRLEKQYDHRSERRDYVSQYTRRSTRRIKRNSFGMFDVYISFGYIPCNVYIIIIRIRSGRGGELFAVSDLWRRREAEKEKISRRERRDKEKLPVAGRKQIARAPSPFHLAVSPRPPY